MNASEIMTRHVITVDREDPLDKAIGLMLKNGISGLPVLDGRGGLAGMLTEGDLLRRVEIGTERKRPRWLEFLVGSGRLAQEYVHAHGRKVEDLMTAEVATVAPDTPVQEIADLMERWQIKRVPVVENGSLVGIVSRANLLQAIAAAADAIPSSSPSDEEIRTRLWNELKKTHWAPCRLITIMVRDGIVHIHGTVPDDRERLALRTAALNTPGVKGVRDFLVWRDFATGLVIESPRDREGMDRPPA